MKVISIFLPVAAALFGLVITIVSYRMYKRYREKYLFDYFYYLLFFCIYGFFNFVGRSFAGNISSHLSLSKHAVGSIQIVFNFTALPFFIIAWYMLIKMLRGLLGKGISPVLKWGYIFFSSIVVLAAVKIIIDYVDSGQPQFSPLAAAALTMINITQWLIMYITIIHVYFFVKEVKDKKMQRLIKNFGYLNLIVLTIYGILFFSIRSNVFYITVMPFLYFSRNLPPLLYLAGFLKTYSKEYSPRLDDDANLIHFFSEFNVTKREQRIIRLICEGKSNKEIEDILFISLQTVKHHVYNIYQKLGIRNRVQLVNLVRRYSESE
ncbi:MAG: helix-turn-helix transcriptional regulator [Candidatus Aminicenantes bacterium]|nr:MAG: helix-turn-helix transcriptional regulator [Candidatus Aminicenantes bacterium]